MADENCETCGAAFEPFGSSGDSGSGSLSAHVTDYNDPHHTLSLVPSVHYGSGIPSAASGYKDKDWYVDIESHAIYSYRVSGGSGSWVRGTPEVPSDASNCVYRSGTGVSRDLDVVLSDFMTSVMSSVASSYATSASLASLASAVASLNVSSCVYRSGGDGTVRDIDSILSDYLKVSDLASAVSGKQDRLVAGANVSIDRSTNVISVSVPATSAATTATAGLMSAADKLYLDSVPGLLAGKQPTLTSSNAGPHVTISNGVISADYPTAASQASAGLMSAADKTKLDGLQNSSYTLPVATSSSLGGVLVATTVLPDLSVADGSSASERQDVDGYELVYVGLSGFAYAKYPGKASADTFGLVRAASVLTDFEGYAKCPVDANGFMYYKSVIGPRATYDEIGGVRVSSSILSDLVTSGTTQTRTTPSGYSMLLIGSSGVAYYKNPETATDSAAGVVKAGSVVTSSDGLAACAVDASGTMYYRPSFVSYESDAVDESESGTVGGESYDATIFASNDRIEEIDGTALSYDYGVEAMAIEVPPKIDDGVTKRSFCLKFKFDSDWEPGYRFEIVKTPVPATDGESVSFSYTGDILSFTFAKANSVSFLRFDETDEGVFSVTREDIVTESGSKTVRSFQAGDSIEAMEEIGGDDDGYAMYPFDGAVTSYGAEHGYSYDDVRLYVPPKKSSGARHFRLVLNFPSDWGSGDELAFTSVASQTASETVSLVTKSGTTMSLSSATAGSSVMFEFTEISAGKFHVERSDLSAISFS